MGNTWVIPTWPCHGSWGPSSFTKDLDGKTCHFRSKHDQHGACNIRKHWEETTALASSRFFSNMSHGASKHLNMVEHGCLTSTTSSPFSDSSPENRQQETGLPARNWDDHDFLYKTYDPCTFT